MTTTTSITTTAPAYQVVKNQEEQYSIWLASKAMPAGWSDTGFAGSKEECLEHIKLVWTDMRPLSLRQQATTVSA